VTTYVVLEVSTDGRFGTIEYWEIVVFEDIIIFLGFWLTMGERHNEEIGLEFFYLLAFFHA